MRRGSTLSQGSAARTISGMRARSAICPRQPQEATGSLRASPPGQVSAKRPAARQLAPLPTGADKREAPARGELAPLAGVDGGADVAAVRRDHKRQGGGRATRGEGGGKEGDGGGDAAGGGITWRRSGKRVVSQYGRGKARNQ